MNVYFIYPASTEQRTISSIQLLFKERLFHLSSFYFTKNYVINPAAT